MQVKIVKSGPTQVDNYWVLLRNDKGDYGVAIRKEVVIPTLTEISYQLFQTIQWYNFENTQNLDLNRALSSFRGYNRNSKFDFGMYEGYEVGIVYSFDAAYIDWCIHNVENFFITDLEVLEKFGIIRWNGNYEIYRELKEGTLNQWCNYFNSIQDIVQQIGMSFTKYHLPAVTKSKNKEKIDNHR